MVSDIFEGKKIDVSYLNCRNLVKVEDQVESLTELVGYKYLTHLCENPHSDDSISRWQLIFLRKKKKELTFLTQIAKAL